MNELLDQIEEALESRLYYVALMGALTLPDIAAALQSEDGCTKAALYMDWLKANFDWTEWAELTPADIYNTRCAMLHQFSAHQQKALRFHRIVFIPPEGGQNPGRVVRQRLDQAQPVGPNSDGEPPFDFYTVDLADFIHDLLAATRAWWNTNASDATVARNRERTFGRRGQEFLPEFPLPPKGYFLS